MLAIQTQTNYRSALKPHNVLEKFMSNFFLKQTIAWNFASRTGFETKVATQGQGN